jgi:hypothetical protein
MVWVKAGGAIVSGGASHELEGLPMWFGVLPRCGLRAYGIAVNLEVGHADGSAEVLVILASTLT